MTGQVCVDQQQPIYHILEISVLQNPEEQMLHILLLPAATLIVFSWPIRCTWNIWACSKHNPRFACIDRNPTSVKSLAARSGTQTLVPSGSTSRLCTGLMPMSQRSSATMCTRGHLHSRKMGTMRQAPSRAARFQRRALRPTAPRGAWRIAYKSKR